MTERLDKEAPMNGATLIISVEKTFQNVINTKERWLRDFSNKVIPVWVMPDHLSITRLLLSFPTLAFVLREEFIVGSPFFIFGALLDLLDGPLARMRGITTKRGAFLDIFADKVLIGLAIIAIFITKAGVVSPVLFWITIGSDLILVTLWFIGVTMPFQSGISRRLGANNWGKSKTLLQSIGIALILIESSNTAFVFLWGAVPLAVASIVGHLTLREKK